MCRLFIWGLLVVAPAWTQPLRVDPSKVLAQGGGIGRARVAFGAGTYAVVWQHDGEIRAMRLRPGTLEPLGQAPARLPGRGTAEFPSVAFAGGVFLAVWQDFHDGTDYDVHGALLDALTGRPRGEIAIAAGPGNQARPAVAAAGNTFLVVWQETGAAQTHVVRGVRISATGQVLDPKPHLYTDAGTSRPQQGREPRSSSPGPGRTPI